MSKVRVISPESAADEHREKIERARKGFYDELEQELKTKPIDFDFEDVGDSDPDEELRGFRGFATDGLNRELAEAGAAEARARSKAGRKE